MKDIVLFDMDGTLTEARKKINFSTIAKLKKLSLYSHIGIVTGSGMDYLVPQLEDLWTSAGVHDLDKARVDPKNITLMPCNGTIVYEWSKGSWKETFSVSIREYLGEEKFLKLFQILVSLNHKIVSDHAGAFPLTGHFISFRNSLINFCPVGRNATDSDRNSFIEYDDRFNLRSRCLEILKGKFIMGGLSNLSVTLGGSTSFDIYPIGWDKTFSLKHFSGKRVWFIGDKCDGDGNDRKLYEALQPFGRSFKTSNPENTREIIDNIIKSFD